MDELHLVFPTNAAKIGLMLSKIEFSSRSNAITKIFYIFLFYFYYGLDSIDVGSIWYDLRYTSVPYTVLPREKMGYNGFKMYMMAHYYVWNYQTFFSSFGKQFSIYKKFCWRELLWKCIRKNQLW